MAWELILYNFGSGHVSRVSKGVWANADQAREYAAHRNKREDRHSGKNVRWSIRETSRKAY